MIAGRGAVQHAVAVRRPLDVAQPAGPVRVPLQVGVEGDGVAAGVACKTDTHNCGGCGGEGWGWLGLGGTRVLVFGDFYLLWGTAGTPP